MKVKVIKEFRDATDSNKQYKVGDIIEVDKERFNVLSGNNKHNTKFVEEVKEKKKEVE